MEFGYEMTQPYNNYFLNAISPAYEIFNSEVDSKAIMVAYDAGEYKTIGANIEFGGLADNNHPSTKKELLIRILGFFGDILTGTGQDVNTGKLLKVDVYPNPFSKKVNFNIQLDKTAPVTLEICDISGKVVYRKDESRLNAGFRQLTWEIESKDNPVNNGLFFYRIISGDEIKTGKLIMIN
jgi:hypothetical protein